MCNDIVIMEHDGRRLGLPDAPVVTKMTTIEKRISHSSNHITYPRTSSGKCCANR